jgi:general secretion pathway protein A
VEELRMLSNFQTDDKSLLQTFLLGQPEFRATLHSPGMQQLRQRVIASYHLGPMDAQETRAYIEHRLATVGWNGDPAFDDGAHAAVFAYSGGIPRKVNTLMDRVLLMGYLEEMHAFGEADINTVISDISEEFQLPAGAAGASEAGAPATDALPGAGLGAMNQELRTLDQRAGERRAASVEVLDERMMRLEKSIVSVLSILKKIVATPQGAVTQPMDNQE